MTPTEQQILKWKQQGFKPVSTKFWFEHEDGQIKTLLIQNIGESYDMQIAQFINKQFSQ